MQPVVEGRWRHEGHCNTGALHRRVGRRRRIEGGVVGVRCWTLGKSEEVGMVRMAKSGTSEGVVKWVGNMDSESKERSVNEEVEVVVIGQAVATWPKETMRLQSRPRDRVSGALKVHFSEQTRFFEPNSNEKTFSLPLDHLFLGE